MHRSRLSTFVIDCKTDDVDAATAFWSKALGRAIEPPKEAKYRELACAPSEPILLIQAVDHDSRIHLDIEADDMDAEVARLEALGAKRVERIKTWVVMEAPTGQRFCVVRPQRGEAVFGTTLWPSQAQLPFTATAQHERLRPMIGRWHGETRTWLDADAPPDTAISELRVDPLFGGRWLRFEQHGTVAGKAHASELLLGYHVDQARWEATLVDSFHTGTAMMWSHGAPRADGVIAVTGSYSAGGETWGWRTELSTAADTLTSRAYNITLGGEEMIAIETVWRKR